MTSRTACFAAADLGASSGRVILGRLADGRFMLAETARFANGPVPAAGPDAAGPDADRRPDAGLHWDAAGLFTGIRDGVERAAAACGGTLRSIAVDTWGVDYGRLDARGELIERPFHYRDERTSAVPEKVFATLDPGALYATAGLQVMPFNTIFQLVASADDPRWPDVGTILLMPDLFAYRLTGRAVAEVTIASTTGLLDVSRRTWSADICRYLAEQHRIPVPRVLPDLVEPGTVLGPTAPGVLTTPTDVVAAGSHDTASAVVAVPARTPRFAYVSSGTWSVVGLELDRPVLGEESRRHDFTNELGVDGTVLYQRNVMGLWVLDECLRAWRGDGRPVELPQLLGAAAREPGLACVVDIDDDRLLPPGDMPSRLHVLAAERGQHLADDPAAVCRCVLDSLALAYRRAVRQACRLADREVDVVHVVGGGSRNELLCRLTAEATRLPVVAGPAEGTALGNLLVQARACGELGGGLAELRRVAVASCDLVEYRPGGLDLPGPAWAAAELVLEAVRSRRS